MSKLTITAKELIEWAGIPLLFALFACIYQEISTYKQKELDNNKNIQQQFTQKNEYQDNLLEEYYKFINETLGKDTSLKMAIIKGGEENCSYLKPNSIQKYLAQSKTVTALSFLNQERRSSIINFLRSSGYLTSLKDKTAPTLRLLCSATFPEYIDLKNLNLQDINLQNTVLIGTDFRGATLSEAKFSLQSNPPSEFSATLNNVNLSNNTLIATEFQSVNLRGSLLKGTIFEGMNFESGTSTPTYLDFSGANLDSSDLRKASFRNVKFIKSSLRKVDLRGAIFKNVDMKDVDLNSADLRGLMPSFPLKIFLGKIPIDNRTNDLLKKLGFGWAISENTSNPENTSSSKTYVNDQIKNLGICNILGALGDKNTEIVKFFKDYMIIFDYEKKTINFNKIDSNVYKKCQKTYIFDFKELDFQGLDFGDTDLFKKTVELNKANLRGADLSKANEIDKNSSKLNGILYDDSTIFSKEIAKKIQNKDIIAYNISPKTDLSKSPNQDLNRVYLYGANLKEAILTNISLIRADLSSADLEKANLENSKLQIADLTNANLSNASLTRADLRGAIIDGTNFKNANLQFAQINEDDLNAAVLCNTTMPSGSIRNDRCTPTERFQLLLKNAPVLQLTLFIISYILLIVIVFRVAYYIFVAYYKIKSKS